MAGDFSHDIDLIGAKSALMIIGSASVRVAVVVAFFRTHLLSASTTASTVMHLARVKCAVCIVHVWTHMHTRIRINNVHLHFLNAYFTMMSPRSK